MNLEQARKTAKKLARQNQKYYTIWRAQNIYGRKANFNDVFVVKPHVPYDKYRDGFIEEVSWK